MPANGNRDKPSAGLLAMYAVLCLALPGLVVGLGIALAFGVGSKNGQLQFRPDVELPLELMGSVLALVGAIAFMVIVFKQLDLTTPNEALGLPDGSIRAILAVSLIFLFLIMSVFLYAQVNAAGKDSPGLDIAKQLVTTVATLAVSVAGFYFGTNAVQSATAAISGSALALKVKSPLGAVTMKKGDTTPQTVELMTSPIGLAIDGRLVGDPKGSLAPTSPTTFVYTPSANPQPTVVLRFSLVSNPEVTASVDVNFTDGAAPAEAAPPAEAATPVEKAPPAAPAAPPPPPAPPEPPPKES
jgi:hypothetical protein